MQLSAGHGAGGRKTPESGGQGDLRGRFDLPAHVVQPGDGNFGFGDNLAWGREIVSTNKSIDWIVAFI